MDLEFIKYQDEDIPRRMLGKNFKFRLGIRHLQLLYMFLMCAAMGALRVSPSVAMLAVTDTSRLNDTYIQIKNWDRKTQGVILYSFFMGYAIMLVPGELFLKRIGGKYTQAVSLLLNGGLCVAMPTVINKGSVLAVSGMHLFMGMSQAWVSPANQALLRKWLPPDERNLFSRILYLGLLVGIIVALPIIGIVSEARLGWELIYYSLAMMAFSMGTICVLLTASSPNKHQAVGDTEKEYIAVAMSNIEKLQMEKKGRENVNVTIMSGSPPSIVWFKILTASQFWKIAFLHIATNVIFIFCLSDMALYLQNFNISLKENTIWMALLYTMWLLIELLRMIALYIYNNIFRWNDIPFKIIFTLSIICILCGLPALLYLLPDWKITAILTLMIIMSSLSIQTHAIKRNVKQIKDLDPDVISIVSSIVASIVGACVPMLTGFLVVDNVNIHCWRYIFFTLMSVVSLCHIMYFVLGNYSKRSARNKGNSIRYLISYDNTSDILEVMSNHNEKMKIEAEK
ncbi:putative inorganic phosphate cotransporter [Achroia grisella]|uniref:putative inorganic phosphate cotransporter n=1 Tax=Achroia grisella TaxID=688607 RepID=UPI0027D31585|nr:putative inorganic phosphate cotransporter [Achroia grisella]